MFSSSEAGSYLKLIDFVYHSTLGLRVIKKKYFKRAEISEITLTENDGEGHPLIFYFFSALLLSSLELSDTKVYEP